MQDDQGINDFEMPQGYLVAQRYAIDRYLGGGGMGNVYLARDNLLNGNLVAIKVLHKEFARDELIKKRFLQEVQLMHLVNHPNVVRTFDVGADTDVIFFTMEYVRGIPLDRFKRSVKIDYTVLENLIIQICEGLDAIHRAEIVHRDLKPANILISEDNLVKIADFGVARPNSSNMTQHREIIGSLDYMAPEIWQGLPLSSAVDFYSLGVILFQLVTGSLPFLSDEPATLMWMHCNSEPESLTVLRPDAPLWLDELVFDLLAKHPEARPSSASEIIARVVAKPSKSEKKTPTAPEFPSFSVKTDEVTKNDLREVDIPLAAPPGSLEDERKQGEEEGSEEEAPKKMRSATSGIIFRENPTSEEIKLHESKVREKLQRKGSGGQSQDGKKGGTVDPDQKETIRRLERTVYWVLLLVLVALLGVSYLLYANWPQLSEFERSRSYSSSSWSNGSRSYSYENDSGDGNPFFLSGLFESLFGGSDDGGSRSSSSSYSSSSSSYTPQPEIDEPQRTPKVYNYSYDKSAWWSYENVKKYFFGDSTSSSSSSASREAAPVRQGSEKNEEESFSIPFFNSRSSESAPSPAPAPTTRAPEPQRPARSEERPSRYRVSEFSPSSFRDQHPVMTETISDERLLSDAELERLQEVKVDDALLALSAEKHALREKLFALSARLNSIDFSASQRASELRSLKNRAQRANVAFGEASRMFAMERQSYTRWARLAQLYKQGKVMNVASELQSYSAEVRQRKAQYDKTSLEYRNAIEQDARAAKVLGAALKEQRQALENAVNQVLRRSLQQEFKDMVHLSSLSDMLKQQQNRIEEQIRIYSSAAKKIREEDRSALSTERERIEVELLELEEKLSANNERLLRRAWALRSATSSS